MSKMFKHVNINIAHDEHLTLGQRVADRVAAAMGSWPFIITQSVILTAWVVLNSIASITHWDNYPYILLNLALSFQAAYAAPFILISQNRQAEKDRMKADQDFLVNLKAEGEVEQVLASIDNLNSKIDLLLKGVAKDGKGQDVV